MFPFYTPWKRQRLDYYAEYFAYPFLANGLILYPLKAPRNQRFSGVFSGYKNGNIDQKWVKGFEFFFIIFCHIS